ncbi:MAG: hypothetical protein IT236_12450, partial [Bacteroidia bacterium]|nr:hypothetical protein [Bacteroidia bacterium]
MKKSYKTIKAFVVLLSLVAMNMSAQLSGVYTIDKTVPASASNFTSVTAFATALNTSGVSGAVTVNVVSNTGPYVEQVTFNQAAGISAVNNVVVNGNGNTLTFSSSNSGQAWTLLLQGADYMTFNDLKVIGTGSYVYNMMLVGGANNNNFNNCNFECPANSTTSNHMNVCFSGANTTYASTGNSGSFNTFTGCTMKSGYYQIVHYGLTSSPYNSDNKFITCKLTDWYYMAVYAYYSKNLTVQGCTIDRDTHNNPGFAYGLYLYYTNGTLIDRNRIQNFWGAGVGTNNAAYPIYCYYNSISGAGPQQNRIQNNVMCKMDNTSYVYGMYCYYMNGFVENNTMDFNSPNNNYTSSYYGFYGYGSGTSYPLTFRNNCITMNVAGSGQRYCAYWPITSGLTSDYNNFYNARAVGTNSTANNYLAYYNGAWNTMTQLQAQGTNLNSWSLDPMYMNPTNISNPQAFLPTNYAMDNKGLTVGIPVDINSQTRGTIPDIGALEFYNTPCSGNPASSSVITPTAILCPNTPLSLGFSSNYTLSGLSYQWQTSTTSSVGPWTSVSGGTNQVHSTTNGTNNVWYSAIITCTNGNQSSNASAGQVLIAGTTTNTAPYYENFEGITANNRYPNCSWSSNNLGSTCLTYIASNANNRVPRSGSKFASFFYSPTGVNYFYSNGVYLNAGVTYSASVWYTTEYYGYNTWSDLSIMLGTSQSTTGLVQIASSNGTAISPVYKSVSNTFTVASSGLYYVAIRGTSTGSSAQYLSWDDLAIEIPCNLNNTSVAINSTTNTVCLGQPVTLTASGATSYTWSNGSNGSSITFTPNGNVTLGVSGTSSLTSCNANASQNIVVNPTPLVSIFTPNSAVCKGSSINLTAFGAASYNWSSGGTGAMVSVSPTVATTYSVIGINSYGCTGKTSVLISVNNLPNLTIASANNQMCVGESLTLLASGANTYTWSSAA